MYKQLSTLSLPIHFYWAKSMHILILCVCMIIFCAAYITINHQPIMSVIFFCMSLFIFGVYVLFVLVFKKPFMIIYPNRLVFFHLFKRNQENIVYFDDIISLHLDKITYKKNMHWCLSITLKDFKNHLIPLVNLRHHQKLNEKQIFDLIEQVYHGNHNPILHDISMTIDDRYNKTILILTVFSLIMFFIYLLTLFK